MWDYENYDFIKSKQDFGKAMPKIYSSFGLLNLFSPTRTDGSYKLDLSIFEQRNVCQIIMEMVRAEGVTTLTEVKFNSKELPEIPKEYLSG